MDDEELIRRSLAGNLEDFGTLVERHQKVLHAFVLRELRDHDAAGEIVQATFVQAYTHLAGFRFEASFRSWIHEIALNRCRSLHRAGKARREVPLADVAEAELSSKDPEALADGPMRSRLEREIARLPPRQRSVLLLRIVSDLPFREIARIEKITENSAKVSYHYAVKRLKEWLR